MDDPALEATRAMCNALDLGHLGVTELKTHYAVEGNLVVSVTFIASHTQAQRLADLLNSTKVAARPPQS